MKTNMKIKIKTPYWIRLAVILAISFATIQAASADVYIIANASNPLRHMSKSDLKAIFLGEKTSWNDGSKIKIVDNLDKKVSEEFYSGFIGKKNDQIKKIWINLMLLGKMRPPESFRDQTDLIDYVASMKEAIAFVSEVKKDEKRITVLKIND